MPTEKNRVPTTQDSPLQHPGAGGQGTGNQGTGGEFNHPATEPKPSTPLNEVIDSIGKDCRQQPAEYLEQSFTGQDGE